MLMLRAVVFNLLYVAWTAFIHLPLLAGLLLWPAILDPVVRPDWVGATSFGCCGNAVVGLDHRIMGAEFV